MAKVKNRKELNLLVALDRGRQRRKAGRSGIVLIAFAVVIAAAAALFYMRLFNETDLLTERRDAALAYVNNPETQDQYNEALADVQEAEAAKAGADALVGAIKAIDSYPDLRSEDLKELFDIAGGKVDLSEISYDRSTGSLSFFARCDSVARVPKFIAALRSCGVFSDVYYSGYAGEAYVSQDAGTTTDEEAPRTTSTKYSLNVTCVVHADEQRATTQPAAEAAEQTEGEAAEDEPDASDAA
jgi:hypothetical protein